MVLSRVLCVLLLVAGCRQSLFDSHGGGGGGGDGGGDDGGGGGDGGIDVPEKCPDVGCIADAARDYTGMQGGANAHWRYLEDNRRYVWTTMLQNNGGFAGAAEPANRVDPCDDSSAGCRALPSALLVSASGMLQDPAIEYRHLFADKFLQLAVRVRVDSGDVRVRLYRNTREDVLFTGSAGADQTTGGAVNVDALRLDRFFLALEPVGAVPVRAAVQIFVIDVEPQTTFPKTCRLAVTFSSFNGNFATNACASNNDLLHRQANMAAAPIKVADVLGQPMSSGYVEPQNNYRGMLPLSRTNAFTVQFWILPNAPPDPLGWLYSDLDQDSGGGFAVRFHNDVNPTKLEAVVMSTAVPPTPVIQGTDYTVTSTWHFFRVTHAGDTVKICVDGTRLATLSLPGPNPTAQPPNLAKNGIYDDINFYSGAIDEVRVFADVLPCD